MPKIDRLVEKHFEKFLVLGLALGVVLLDLFVIQKTVFLNFYYLPVLVSGYVLGRRSAILTAFLCIGLVAFAASVNPSFVTSSGSSTTLALDLVIWGGFLILAAYVVGTLYQHKEQKIEELKNAYIGVIEILTKYLEANDRYTRGHSVRVADYATDIASLLRLPKEEVQQIRAAALLHNIGRMEISSNLIRKAAKLTIEKHEIMGTETEKGTELLRAVGDVLEAALPITLAFHQYYIQGSDGDKPLADIPIGAQILHVADRFDEMTVDSAYRKSISPEEAIGHLEESAGARYQPEIVAALKRVYAAKGEGQPQMFAYQD